MIELSEEKILIENLLKSNPRLIAIDGIDGAGKSTLADSLANELNFVHINLDDYLEKDRGQFIKFLDYDRLKEELIHQEKPIIIDGVCLFEALERLETKADIVIYVRRISTLGVWRDEEECDVGEDVEEFLNRKKEDLIRFCEIEARIEGIEFNPDEHKFPQFREEIIRYHFKYKPHQKADIVFNRITANH